jgi:outer membrane protein assembly factor BamD (BamD/ComL family)
MTGLNYYMLSDYSQAADAFRRVPEIFPRHGMADSCMYQAGYCYEKLMDSNSISAAEAKPFIESQYTQLLKKYPKSFHVPAAKAWLQGKTGAVTISSCVAGKGGN